MPDLPFHLTRMGARFYEHTMPELVRQLDRLNENLERLLDRGPERAAATAEAGGGGAGEDPER